MTPLRNRVTPLGELMATPERGLVYGNRGCLHDAEGRIRRNHASRRWIACRLEFRGRRRAPLMQPGRYTELFFLDEATAFAAGHRPCAECRRADYDALIAVWRDLHPGQAGADAIDAQLHAERLEGRSRRLHRAGELPDRAFVPRSGELPDGAFVLRSGELPDGAFVLRSGELPDGAFVVRSGEPWLVRGGALLRWTPGGYTDRAPLDPAARLLTPPSLVALLRRGWQGGVPLLHPSADANGAG